MSDMILPSKAASSARPAVRRLTLADLRTALRRGWGDFAAKRGDMVFLGLIYPIVGLLAAFAFSRGDLLPMLFPLSAGLALLGPALASGFYELARRREAGEDPHWTCVFEVFRTPPFAALAGLTALVGAVFGLWLFAAYGLHAATLGSDPPLAPAAFWNALWSTPQGWTLIGVGNLVGFAFAVLVLAVSIVSFPMVIDRRAGPVTAAETSLRFAAANPGVTAAWGLVVAGLLALGSIPLFVGLAVVLPVLGYATWHLYTLAVER